MSDIVSKFNSVRKRTEDLCSPLNTEDYVVQPVFYASPPKWHLAHTSWFFEELILKKYASNYREFNPEFAFLFNSYYNTIGDRTLRAERGNITRPGVSEIYDYRNHVNENMMSLFQSHDINDELQSIIELGLNHEQQHQELLLTDFKFTLGHNPLFPIYNKDFDEFPKSADKDDWVKMDAGIYEIGFDGDSFSFDNEHGRHKVYLEEYQLSKGLVTNGEYLEFIESGAYSKFQYWLDEAWTWITEEGISSPLYWHKIKGEWFFYTLAGLKKVDPDAILCHVSYYEANAFANWKGMRLPTEFEWEAASDLFSWGDRWEWTNSAYLAYPGFKLAEGALGEYNGKFMVNQMVLRGASEATSPGHSRKTYRNFFHPHYQWQYSGIRLAK